MKCPAPHVFPYEANPLAASTSYSGTLVRIPLMVPKCLKELSFLLLACVACTPSEYRVKDSLEREFLISTKLKCNAMPIQPQILKVVKAGRIDSSGFEIFEIGITRTNKQFVRILNVAESEPKQKIYREFSRAFELWSVRLINDEPHLIFKKQADEAESLGILALATGGETTRQIKSFQSDVLALAPMSKGFMGLVEVYEETNSKWLMFMGRHALAKELKLDLDWQEIDTASGEVVEVFRSPSDLGPIAWTKGKFSQGPQIFVAHDFDDLRQLKPVLPKEVSGELFLPLQLIAESKDRSIIFGYFGDQALFDGAYALAFVSSSDESQWQILSEIEPGSQHPKLLMEKQKLHIIYPRQVDQKMYLQTYLYQDEKLLNAKSFLIPFESFDLIDAWKGKSDATYALATASIDEQAQNVICRLEEM
jgi:hypothetical protein